MKLFKRIGKVIGVRFEKGIGWVDSDINMWQFSITLQTKKKRYTLELITIRFD